MKWVAAAIVVGAIIIAIAIAATSGSDQTEPSSGVVEVQLPEPTNESDCLRRGGDWIEDETYSYMGVCVNYRESYSLHWGDEDGD